MQQSYELLQLLPGDVLPPARLSLLNALPAPQPSQGVPTRDQMFKYTSLGTFLTQTTTQTQLSMSTQYKRNRIQRHTKGTQGAHAHEALALSVETRQFLSDIGNVSIG